MKDNVNLNEETSASQAKRILAHLKKGKRITGIEALELFGCFRLPARIADIRELGYDIRSEYVITASGKRVKAYWL